MRVRGIRVLLGAALAAFGGCALASVGVNKSFTPNSVSAGQSSTLTIVFLNPNPASATATAVTDTLPGSVVVANPANATTTCGGAVDATPGNGSVGLSGGTIPATSGGSPGQCQVTVSVLSGTAGTYIDTIPVSAVSSSQGANSQAAQATLVVAALSAVTGTKTFAPANVHGGGSASTMTIRLNNANGVALTNAAFTDAFPANLALATAPTLSPPCSGTVTGAVGGTSVQLSGGTIPASGSCTIAATVVTPDPTVAVNASRANNIPAGGVTTAQGVTNTAISGSITVQSGAAVTKAFAPTTIGSGGTATLTITVSNFNASALGAMAFTDTFPGTMVVANPAAASTTCGGTLTATPAAGSISLSGGALGAAPSGAGGTACTVKVNVTATNGGASATTLANTIPAGNFGGINYHAGSASLVVNPASNISGTKTYSPSPVQSGTTVATVTLANAGASAATINAFTDNLTTLGTGFTVAASPAPGGTCGATITALPGGTPVTATGGSIPAGGSCTITFPVAIAINAASGGHINTIAANGVQTSQGNNVLAITGPMDLSRAFSAAKTFSPATVRAGSKSTATITFTRNANAVPLSNLSFTDTLPAGHTVASPPNASTTCGGTLTASAGAGSFALAGGSLGAGQTSCTVAVDVATPASAGSATNAIAAGAVTTAEGATNVAFSATLTRVQTSVTVNKSFTPATVAVNSVSQLAIQIRNNNANAIALTGVGLVDNFPIGMGIASPAGLALTGSGCTSTFITASATQLTLTGAAIAANAICTLTANVKASAAGNLIDTLPVGVVTSAQGVSNPAAVAATLASSGSASLSIGKTDGTATATPGGGTIYTIAVSNSGPSDVAGLAVNDTPAAGVTFTSWTCTPSAGSQCTASGSGAIADLTTLLTGGTLTYSVNAAFAPDLTGTTTNTASLGVPGSVVDTNPGTGASDTDTLVPATSLAVTKSDAASTYAPGLGATYTIVVTNGGPSDALGVTVGDALPAGVTLAGSATCVAAGGASCGTVSGSAGQSSFGAVDAIVPASGGSQLTLTVPVAFAPSMGAASITNTVTVTDAPSGGSASASDTDTRAAQVALRASKSDGASTYTPGATATYTIVVGNSGPSSALDVTIADPLPAGVTLTGAAGCSASAGSSCGTVSGGAGASSAGATAGTIAPGGSLTFTLPVRFGASMGAASIANTVTVSDAASGASTSATDADSRSGLVALAVTKTNANATYTPGGTASYVVVVTNSGPSDARAVALNDALPPGVTLSSAATCVTNGNATCGTLSGSVGATSVTLTGATLAAGAPNSVTLTLPVAFASSLTTDPLVNTVSVTDPDDPLVHSASDSDALARNVVLAVTKSDGSASYTPGGNATYTIGVTNTGTSDAANVTVSDVLPAGVTLAGAVACVASGTATCGTLEGSAGQGSFAASGATLPAGSGQALTFSVPVAFASSLTADPLTNTASASAAGGAAAVASDADVRAESLATPAVPVDRPLALLLLVALIALSRTSRRR